MRPVLWAGRCAFVRVFGQLRDGLAGKAGLMTWFACSPLQGPRGGCQCSCGMNGKGRGVRAWHDQGLYGQVGASRVTEGPMARGRGGQERFGCTALWGGAVALVPAGRRCRRVRRSLAHSFMQDTGFNRHARFGASRLVRRSWGADGQDRSGPVGPRAGARCPVADGPVRVRPVPIGPVPIGPVPFGPVPVGPVPVGPVPVGPIAVCPVPDGLFLGDLAHAGAARDCAITGGVIKGCAPCRALIMRHAAPRCPANGAPIFGAAVRTRRFRGLAIRIQPPRNLPVQTRARHRGLRQAFLQRPARDPTGPPGVRAHSAAPCRRRQGSHARGSPPPPSRNRGRCAYW